MGSTPSLMTWRGRLRAYGPPITISVLSAVLVVSAINIFYPQTAWWFDLAIMTFSLTAIAANTLFATRPVSGPRPEELPRFVRFVFALAGVRVQACGCLRHAFSVARFDADLEQSASATNLDRTVRLRVEKGARIYYIPAKIRIGRCRRCGNHVTYTQPTTSWNTSTTACWRENRHETVADLDDPVIDPANTTRLLSFKGHRTR